MSRLRTYGPMSRKSEKVAEGETAYQAVYRAVDARSDGKCEVNLVPFEPRLRCNRQARHHHHTVKPRRSNHSADLIIAVCPYHHDRCDWPYHKGRLIIEPLGEGQFSCKIITAENKWATRGSA